MHIQHVEIGNFRKLQAVRVDFSEETTVFVGANNSGKTSAMVALRHFLVDRTDFSINDFTLSHWAKLDAMAIAWETSAPGEKEAVFDWGGVLPHLDVWLNVPTQDLHYVQKILPTLDWAGAYIGVRLRYEPKDIQALKQEYLAAKLAAASVMGAALTSAEGEAAAMPPLVEGFALWPKSMMDFLSLRLRSSFEVRAYLLDPEMLVMPKNGIATPQALPFDSEPIEGDPFKKIIRIDEISAQRGFGFVKASNRGDDSQEDGNPRGGKKLSSQLRNYYTQHLDPFDRPEPKDLEALQALHSAQAAFGKRLATCFSAALKELEDIGYPGVTDPKLTITTSIKPIDGLNHASAVQYEVPTHLKEGGGFAHRLPEDSNGLGYQNLVSIVFALMSFRDKWMKVGKAAKSTDPEEALIPPLHLVLIEEPEAHLHAQVQQVFIKQAYDVLRKHDKLKTTTDLRTQLVVSTHSSHLAHEADFASLRYFRRLAYQQPIAAKFKSDEEKEALANTFEDALVYENLDLFQKMEGTGLMGRIRKSLDEATDLGDLATSMLVALAKGGKAEFTMDLLDSDEIETMKVPAYIDSGLLWLAAQLKRKEDGMSGKFADPAEVLESAAEVAKDSA